MRRAAIASTAAETYPVQGGTVLPTPTPSVARDAVVVNPAGTAYVLGAVAPDLVFQPGGTDAELVFTDFAQLCTYAARLPAKRIRFDYTLVSNSFILPAESYDFGANATWLGSNDVDDPTLVEIADGAVFATAPIAFDGAIEVFNDGASPWTLADPLDSASITVGPNATLDGTDLFAIVGISVEVRTWGVLGAGAFASSAGGRAKVFAYEGSSIEDAFASGTKQIHVLTTGVTLSSTLLSASGTTIAAGVLLVGTGSPTAVTNTEGVFFWSSDRRLLYVVESSAWRVLPQNQFVFSPGGTDAPGVFTSWAALCAVLVLLPGVRVIDFDLSHAADNFAMPAGAFDHGPNVMYVGLVRTGAGNVPTLTFSLGTQLSTAPVVVENLSITVTQTGQEVIATPVGNATRIEVRGTSGDAVLQPQLQSSAGAKPFIGITTGSDFVLILRGTAQLINGGAPVILDHGIATTITFRVFDEATIAASAVTLQGANRAIIRIDSPAVNVDFSYAQFVVLLPGCPWAATGAPETNVPGPTGALYVNKTGGAATTFFVKESSPTTKTGWIGK